MNRQAFVAVLRRDLLLALRRKSEVLTAAAIGAFCASSLFYRIAGRPGVGPAIGVALVGLSAPFAVVTADGWF